MASFISASIALSARKPPLSSCDGLAATRAIFRFSSTPQGPRGLATAFAHPRNVRDTGKTVKCFLHKHGSLPIRPQMASASRRSLSIPRTTCAIVRNRISANYKSPTALRPPPYPTNCETFVARFRFYALTSVLGRTSTWMKTFLRFLVWSRVSKPLHRSIYNPR
jgi:hypothetical protein